MAVRVKESDKGLVEVHRAVQDRDVDRLIAFLRDPDPGCRNYAAIGLRKAGDRRAVRPLLPLLGASDFNVRTSAVQALGDLGDESVLPRLREVAMDDPHQIPRSWAVAAVGQLGGAAEFGFLAARLDDPDVKVRHAAAYSLGLLHDPRATGPLEQAMQRERRRDRKIYRTAIERSLGRRE
jgi:HEAT repeat protein